MDTPRSGGRWVTLVIPLAGALISLSPICPSTTQCDLAAPGVDASRVLDGAPRSGHPNLTHVISIDSCSRADARPAGRRARVAVGSTVRCARRARSARVRRGGVGSRAAAGPLRGGRNGAVADRARAAPAAAFPPRRGDSRRPRRGVQLDGVLLRGLAEAPRV